MNLVGKIFIVLIFIMSLVWMSLTAAVYATHRNWRDVVMNQQASADKPMGLLYQLKDARQRNEDLQLQYDKLTSELERQKNEKRQALLKLETENKELTDQLDQQSKENARLEQDRREAVAATDAIHKTLDALRGEVDGLRQEIRDVQKDRDEQFTNVVQLTDDLHQAVNERIALKARNTTVAADYGRAMEVLRKFGLTDDPGAYSGVPPNALQGVVLASRSDGMVEISIGADDGLMKGHTLEVYRAGEGQSTYLGRLVVTDTNPDRAAARIVPEFQKGAIQRGDRVASKLN